MDPTAKKSRVYNSRVIRTQINDPAFLAPSKGPPPTAAQLRKSLAKGISNQQNQQLPQQSRLVVPELLAARDFEVRALESAMVSSKTSGASRVFQSLPRSLRRRTASHNVRRIPKRMRKKALREMGIVTKNPLVAVVSTTKGVGSTGKPVNPKLGRGRKRWTLLRRIKLLNYASKWKLKGKLPDSTWVSTQGSGLRDKIKALKKQLVELNDQIDNTSTDKPATISHLHQVRYATRQRKFKWLATHIWHAKRAHMCKRWGWNIPLSPTQKCYRNTSRSARIRGAVAFDTSYYSSLAVNCPLDKIDELSNYMKLITDNKFDITQNTNKSWSGFIYNSTEPIGKVLIVSIQSQDQLQLLLTLHPSIYDSFLEQIIKDFSESTISIDDCKYSLGSIELTGPKSLTALQSIIHPYLPNSDFMNLHKICDLTTIPNTVFTFSVSDPRHSTKPILPTNPKLSYDEQLDLLISLKKQPQLNNDLLSSENRNESYKNQQSLKQLGKRRYNYPGESIPVTSKDPKIPIMIIKRGQNWIVQMPWFWILPFWYTLVHVPHVQFGGLKQYEQLQYERKLISWSDMVFTPSGFVQCELERTENQKKWNKRPVSKRVNYTKVKISNGEKGELLSPFGLDWRGLQVLRLVTKVTDNKTPLPLQTIDGDFQIKSLSNIQPIVSAISSAEQQLRDNNQQQLILKHKPITIIPQNYSNPFKFNIIDMPPLQISPVILSCVGMGNIKPNARIYSVPVGCEEKWKTISTGESTGISGQNLKMVTTDNYSTQLPQLHDLIGLVTNGSFNLVDGKCTCIGYIDSQMIANYVLIRNIASSVFTMMDVQKCKYQ